MTSDSEQTLANIPIRRIRAFLRQVQQRRWESDAVEAAFPDSGEEVLKALLDDGYAQETSEPGTYKTTLKGDTLVEAAAPRPASRKKNRRP
jgi:hypothetical protein